MCLKRKIEEHRSHSSVIVAKLEGQLSLSRGIRSLSSQTSGCLENIIEPFLQKRSGVNYSVTELGESRDVVNRLGLRAARGRECGRALPYTPVYSRRRADDELRLSSSCAKQEENASGYLSRCYAYTVLSLLLIAGSCTTGQSTMNPLPDKITQTKVE